MRADNSDGKEVAVCKDTAYTKTNYIAVQALSKRRNHHPPSHPDEDQDLRWMMSHAWEILKPVQDDTMRGFHNWLLSLVFPQHKLIILKFKTQFVFRFFLSQILENSSDGAV